MRSSDSVFVNETSAVLEDVSDLSSVGLSDRVISSVLVSVPEIVSLEDADVVASLVSDWDNVCVLSELHVLVQVSVNEISAVLEDVTDLSSVRLRDRVMSSVRVSVSESVCVKVLVTSSD